jgi:hypothetical protein
MWHGIVGRWCPGIVEAMTMAVWTRTVSLEGFPWSEMKLGPLFAWLHGPVQYDQHGAQEYDGALGLRLARQRQVSLWVYWARLARWPYVRLQACECAWFQGRPDGSQTTVPVVQWSRKAHRE